MRSIRFASKLELDEQRGRAPLPVRATALKAASAAYNNPAERQALIDLGRRVCRPAPLASLRPALAHFERRPGPRSAAGKRGPNLQAA